MIGVGCALLGLLGCFVTYCLPVLLALLLLSASPFWVFGLPNHVSCGEYFDEFRFSAA